MRQRRWSHPSVVRRHPPPPPAAAAPPPAAAVAPPRQWQWIVGAPGGAGRPALPSVTVAGRIGHIRSIQPPQMVASLAPRRRLKPGPATRGPVELRSRHRRRERRLSRGGKARCLLLGTSAPRMHLAGPIHQATTVKTTVRSLTHRFSACSPHAEFSALFFVA